MRFGSSAGEDPFAKVRALISDMTTKLEAEAVSEAATEKTYCDEQMAKTVAKKEELNAEIAKITAKIDQAADASETLKAKVQQLASMLQAGSAQPPVPGTQGGVLCWMFRPCVGCGRELRGQQRHSRRGASADLRRVSCRDAGGSLRRRRRRCRAPRPGGLREGGQRHEHERHGRCLRKAGCAVHSVCSYSLAVVLKVPCMASRGLPAQRGGGRSGDLGPACRAQVAGLGV